MIRVGVIADTHDILKEEVLNELKQCDYTTRACHGTENRAFPLPGGAVPAKASAP